MSVRLVISNSGNDLIIRDRSTYNSLLPSLERPLSRIGYSLCPDYLNTDPDQGTSL